MSMNEIDVLDLLFGPSEDGVLTASSKQSEAHEFPSSDSLQYLLDQNDLRSIKENGADVDDMSIPSDACLSLPLDISDEIFQSLLDANMDDDSKQMKQCKYQVTDHEYSRQLTEFPQSAYTSQSSPDTDSGIASPTTDCSNSTTNSFQCLTTPTTDDFDFSLFDPITRKNGTDIGLESVNPLLIERMSVASSPGDTVINFDFENTEFDEEDDTFTPFGTENMNCAKLQNYSCVSPASDTSDSYNTEQPFKELVLSDEEKALLIKGGITLPKHYPLTRQEQSQLRSIRRKIRNKASAKKSRKNKQDYIESLEKRVKIDTDERRKMEKQISQLENQNASLLNQIKRLQKMVVNGTRKTAQASTCAMILALSFALILLPNLQSFHGSQSIVSKRSAVMAGNSRSLLATLLQTETTAKKSYQYIPFINFAKVQSHSPYYDEELPYSSKSSMDVDSVVDVEVTAVSELYDHTNRDVANDTGNYRSALVNAHNREPSDIRYDELNDEL